MFVVNTGENNHAGVNLIFAWEYRSTLLVPMIAFAWSDMRRNFTRCVLTMAAVELILKDPSFLLITYIIYLFGMAVVADLACILIPIELTLCKLLVSVFCCAGVGEQS
jgi:hypothetical protein